MDLKRIGEIAAAVTSVAFVTTVAYMFGYSIGLEFPLQRYATPADYLRISVQWVPIMLILWSANLARLYSRAMRDMDLASPNFDPRFAKRYVARNYKYSTPISFGLNIFYTIFLVLCIIIDAMNVFAPAVWGLFMGNIYSRTHLEFMMNDSYRKFWFKLNIIGKILTRHLPLFILASGVLGYYYGDYQGVFRKNDMVKIEVEGNRDVRGGLIFVLDEFVIVDVEDSDIVVIPKSKVERIAYLDVE